MPSSAKKPYAIGERPGGNPLTRRVAPLLTGKAAADSLIGYVGSRKRMDSVLNAYRPVDWEFLQYGKESQAPVPATATPPVAPATPVVAPTGPAVPPVGSGIGDAITEFRQKLTGAGNPAAKTWGDALAGGGQYGYLPHLGLAAGGLIGGAHLLNRSADRRDAEEEERQVADLYKDAAHAYPEQAGFLAYAHDYSWPEARIADAIVKHAASSPAARDGWDRFFGVLAVGFEKTADPPVIPKVNLPRPAVTPDVPAAPVAPGVEPITGTGNIPQGPTAGATPSVKPAPGLDVPPVAKPTGAGVPGWNPPPDTTLVGKGRPLLNPNFTKNLPQSAGELGNRLYDTGGKVVDNLASLGQGVRGLGYAGVGAAQTLGGLGYSGATRLGRLAGVANDADVAGSDAFLRSSVRGTGSGMRDALATFAPPEGSYLGSILGTADNTGRNSWVTRNNEQNQQMLRGMGLPGQAAGVGAADAIGSTAAQMAAGGGPMGAFRGPALGGFKSLVVPGAVGMGMQAVNQRAEAGPSQPGPADGTGAPTEGPQGGVQPLGQPSGLPGGHDLAMQAAEGASPEMQAQLVRDDQALAAQQAARQQAGGQPPVTGEETLAATGASAQPPAGAQPPAAGQPAAAAPKPEPGTPQAAAVAQQGQQGALETLAGIKDGKISREQGALTLQKHLNDTTANVSPEARKLAAGFLSDQKLSPEEYAQLEPMLAQTPAAAETMKNLADQNHPNPQKGFMDQFSSMPGWAQAAVAIGLPMAVIGLGSALFGGGGMGGMLATILGIGGIAAGLGAFGTHEGPASGLGGMLSGFFNSGGGPETPGGTPGAAAGPENALRGVKGSPFPGEPEAFGAGVFSPGGPAPADPMAAIKGAPPGAAFQPAGGALGPGQIPGDVNQDQAIDPQEQEAITKSPQLQNQMAALPVDQRAKLLAPQIQNLAWYQKPVVDNIYNQFKGGDMQGAVQRLVELKGLTPQAAQSMLEAYGYLQQNPQLMQQRSNPKAL